MPYPATPPPAGRTDSTPLPTNHPTDHNLISQAITDIVNELGSNPSGSAASLTALLDEIDPADKIITIAGSTAPTGWGLCDGTTALIADAPATFARIGTTYGGDGITTFGKPDLRSRFIAGKGTATWSDTLNESGGSKDAVAVAHAHGIDHNHPSKTTSEDTHTHNAQGLGYLYRDVNYANNQSVVTPPDDGGPYAVNFHVDTEADTHSHTVDLDNFVGDTNSQAPTADGVDDNLPPYLTLNYAIRLR